MKAFITLALSFVLLVVIALAGYDYLVTTPNKGGQIKTIIIKKGETLRKTADRLEKAGLIKSALMFEMEARRTGADEKIRAGEYRLDGRSSIRDVLQTLLSGRVVLYRVTIPEGFDVSQIAELLDAKKMVGKNVFLKITRNRTFLKQSGIEADTAEGYLFPETYLFSRNVTAKEVAQTMIKMFHQQISKIEGIKNLAGKKLHELITLASLVEKESALPEERAVIASVYTNRLAKGMLLQCDPTVIYALPNFDGNIHKRDLDIDSPYNTYRYPGLPPGPIANPGLSSIKAALHPAKTNYLYFVAKKAGGAHYFSRTLKEHNNAVIKYQKQAKR